MMGNCDRNCDDMCGSEVVSDSMKENRFQLANGYQICGFSSYQLGDSFLCVSCIFHAAGIN